MFSWKLKIEKKDKTILIGFAMIQSIQKSSFILLKICLTLIALVLLIYQISPTD